MRPRLGHTPDSVTSRSSKSGHAPDSTQQLMHIMVDYDSDEDTTNVQPAWRPAKGLSALKEVCKDPEKLRRDTKEMYDLLEFGTGSPDTVDNMRRAQHRFNHLRETILNDTEKQPPSTEAIICIMAAMVMPCNINPAAISMSTFKQMYAYSIQSIQFDYPAWHQDPGLHLQFAALCDKMYRQGTLTGGQYLEDTVEQDLVKEERPTMSRGAHDHQGCSSSRCQEQAAAG